MDNSIPVFYHVPKCAGTYVKNTLACHFGVNNGLCTHLMDDQNRGIAITFGPRTYREDINIPPAEKFVLRNYNRVKDSLSKRTFTALMISARGFAMRDDIIQACNIREHKSYMLLRNTYERTYSLYHYLSSDKSKHEPTHGSINSKTFEEYLQSDQLEDCWLIRNLIGISDNKIIDQHDYEAACRILDDINIRDIRDVESLLREMIGKKNHSHNVNSNNSGSSNKRLSLESFDQHVIEAFNQRTYWDQKIYNYYI